MTNEEDIQAAIVELALEGYQAMDAFEAGSATYANFEDDARRICKALEDPSPSKVMAVFMHHVKLSPGVDEHDVALARDDMRMAQEYLMKEGKWPTKTPS